MEKITMKKLFYDINVKVISGIILLALTFMGNKIVSLIIIIFPLSDLFYRIASNNDLTVLHDYQFGIIVLIVFILIETIEFTNDRIFKDIYNSTDKDLKNFKIKTGIEIEPDKYNINSLTQEELVDSAISGWEEIKELVIKSRKRFKVFFWSMYLLLIFYFIIYNFQSVAISKGNTINNKIIWLSQKLSTKEINKLNARKVTMKNEKDFLVLDSLINYYSNIPDSTIIK